MLPALWTRNPLYLSLELAAVGLVYTALARRPDARTEARGWRVMLRLGLLLATLTALIPPLLVHYGETVLLRLPALSLPLPGVADTPMLGGPVTLESVAYGVATALGLTALLLTFATFNLAVEPYALLRALPRSLARSGVVLSIAVTFVPQMMEAQREIREAQALRGHRFRGLRDLAPLFVTLLGEGLERSITLAESMEARGFSAGSRSRGPGARAALLSGFALLAAGAAVRVWAPEGWSRLAGLAAGDGLLLLGLVTLLGALVRLGRTTVRTRLRRSTWGRRDTAVAAAAGLSLLLLLLVHLTGGRGLGWYPYPRVLWPETDGLALAALALLAAPAVVVGSTHRPRRPSEDAR